MRPRYPIHAPSLTSSVTRVSELKAAGVPHWRLHAGDVQRVFHGLAVAPGEDPEAFETKVKGLRRLMVPGRFISRRTAARLHDLPTTGDAVAFDVGAIRPTKPPRHAGIRGHQVRPGVFEQLPSAPTWLPTPEEVWALLASTESLEQLVIIGDYLISGPSREDRPLCTQSELKRVVRRFSGSSGISRLQAALPLLRTGVESPAESQTRLLIVRAGLPEPQTCCPVALGGLLLHADLGYPQWRIAIEYDGSYHFTNGLAQARKDNSRREAMIDAGWRVLTVTALDLRDPADFLRRLALAIANAIASANAI